MDCAYGKVLVEGSDRIPKAIRDRLGLKKDMALEISVERSLILLKPLRDDAWLGLEGSLKGTSVLKDLEAEHRQEIERGD